MEHGPNTDGRDVGQDTIEHLTPALLPSPDRPPPGEGRTSAERARVSGEQDAVSPYLERASGLAGR